MMQHTASTWIRSRRKKLSESDHVFSTSLSAAAITEHVAGVVPSGAVRRNQTRERPAPSAARWVRDGSDTAAGRAMGSLLTKRRCGSGTGPDSGVTEGTGLGSV